MSETPTPKPPPPHPLDTLKPPEGLSDEGLALWCAAIVSAKAALPAKPELPLFEGQVVVHIHAQTTAHAGHILGDLMRVVQWHRAVERVVIVAPMQPHHPAVEKSLS